MKFFRLFNYIVLQKCFAQKDGYYVKLSSKYHQVSKEFTVYYLESGEYICCFDGTFNNKFFKLDLDNLRPFGRNSILSTRNLDLPQIKERVRLFLSKYYPEIICK